MLDRDEGGTECLSSLISPEPGALSLDLEVSAAADMSR
jgi:hypothetical protein